MTTDPDSLEVKSAIDGDERLAAVFHLAETCNYEEGHTLQVTRLVLKLFDELTPIHHLSTDERFWLQSAALLHDIGWIEGQKGHHKTSLHIILSTPLLPFDNKERLIVGSIARYHRNALPSQKHDHFAVLDPKEQKIVCVLASLLRVADGLDRAHSSNVIDLKCKISPHKVKVICLCHEKNPLESQKPFEKGDLFEQVFERKLEIKFEKAENE